MDTDILKLLTVGAASFGITMFIAQLLFPLRQQRCQLVYHVFVNLCVAAGAFIVARTFVRPLASFFISSHEFKSWLSWSLTSPFEGMPFLKAALAFVLLDLSFYYWHRLNHEWSFLWRFHNVHHVDLDVDVTTGFRFHLIEVAFSGVFRVVQVVVIGCSWQVYVLYEFCFQCATMFHHANVRLPLFLEKLLAFVIITPRLHGLHHSIKKEQAFSNYSVIFSVWDRMHGSFTKLAQGTQVTTGVPAYAESDDQTFWALMVMPFRKQRDYWRER